MFSVLRHYAREYALECLAALAEVAFSRIRSVERDVFVVPTIDGRVVERFENVGACGACTGIQLRSPRLVVWVCAVGLRL